MNLYMICKFHSRKYKKLLSLNNFILKMCCNTVITKSSSQEIISYSYCNTISKSILEDLSECMNYLNLRK
jgi:hypothetical protein